MKKDILSKMGSLEILLMVEAEAKLHLPVILKAHHEPDIIIIEDLPTRKIIEINGIKYCKREEKKSSHKGLNKFAVMAAMYGGLGMSSASSTPRKRPNVNIEKEFELIQNKKSVLSRNDRDWVCNQFNYMYERIEEAT